MVNPRDKKSFSNSMNKKCIYYHVYNLNLWSDSSLPTQ